MSKLYYSINHIPCSDAHRRSTVSASTTGARSRSDLWRPPPGLAQGCGRRVDRGRGLAICGSVSPASRAPPAAGRSRSTGRTTAGACRTCPGTHRQPVAAGHRGLRAPRGVYVNTGRRRGVLLLRWQLLSRGVPGEQPGVRDDAAEIRATGGTSGLTR